jgi:hypothetical protein
MYKDSSFETHEQLIGRLAELVRRLARKCEREKPFSCGSKLIMFDAWKLRSGTLDANTTSKRGVCTAVWKSVSLHKFLCINSQRWVHSRLLEPNGRSPGCSRYVPPYIILFLLVRLCHVCLAQENAINDSS